jgi:hypothetical protein
LKTSAISFDAGDSMLFIASDQARSIESGSIGTARAISATEARSAIPRASVRPGATKKRSCAAPVSMGFTDL